MSNSIDEMAAQLRVKLQDAPPPKSNAARARLVVARLAPEIQKMARDGYTLREISEYLSTPELPIPASALRTALDAGVAWSDSEPQEGAPDAQDAFGGDDGGSDCTDCDSCGDAPVPATSA